MYNTCGKIEQMDPTVERELSPLSRYGSVSLTVSFRTYLPADQFEGRTWLQFALSRGVTSPLKWIAFEITSRGRAYLPINVDTWILNPTSIIPKCCHRKGVLTLRAISASLLREFKDQVECMDLVETLMVGFPFDFQSPLECCYVTRKEP